MWGEATDIVGVKRLVFQSSDAPVRRHVDSTPHHMTSSQWKMHISFSICSPENPSLLDAGVYLEGRFSSASLPDSHVILSKNNHRQTQIMSLPVL